MATPTQKQSALFAAALAGVIAAVVAGNFTFTRNAAKTKISIVAWNPGDPTAATKCIVGERWLAQRFLKRWQAAAATDSDGGPTSGAYCYVRLCGNPTLLVEQDRYDEGDMPAIGPQGVIAWQAGFGTMDIWCHGDTTDPSPCACGKVGECEYLADDNVTWKPGLPNRTYGNGRWRNAAGAVTGCVRKACVEVAGGVSSMPAACL